MGQGTEDLANKALDSKDQPVLGEGDGLSGVIRLDLLDYNYMFQVARINLYFVQFKCHRFDHYTETT